MNLGDRFPFDLDPFDFYAFLMVVCSLSCSASQYEFVCDSLSGVQSSLHHGAVILT